MEYEMKKCVIIGSSPCEYGGILNEIDRDHSFIICADGGLDVALEHHLTPDLLIGDFDSVKNELPKNIETIRLNKEKDDTDMMAAIKEAIKRGYRDFTLFGALGGRIDHSFSNFCALQYLASQGCKAVIADRDCRVFLLSGGRLTLSGLKGRMISVFPFGVGFCTVSYEGMKYPLREASISSAYPLGVSNEITEDQAQIFVHSGNALIFLLS
ncbi:thiamine diphosphokinase [Clostridium sp. KNHs216]|jgi:thiamine pyrophosphokinase|uniref:thiamine diphosphokinase n=1 Tax=Eubacteriales TaxID=186802 RepID=UPI00116B5C1B|nr:thiamine diphosphokinase [Clostridium sp. KNHs216]TQI65697.1 thiamine pyrophosphokinase [Clostridium sp. KNHs216]